MKKWSHAKARHSREKKPYTRSEYNQQLLKSNFNLCCLSSFARFGCMIVNITLVHEPGSVGSFFSGKGKHNILVARISALARTCVSLRCVWCGIVDGTLPLGWVYNRNYVHCTHVLNVRSYSLLLHAHTPLLIYMTRLNNAGTRR